MQIKQLEYAREISLCGSITEVAEKMYISRQALSESIKLLEKELGFIIFQRSNKGVVPTEEGQAFLKDLDIILPLVADWSHLAVKQKEKIPIKIFVQHSLGNILSDPEFFEAIERLSNLKVEWETIAGGDILEQVKNEMTSIGLLMPSLHGKTLLRLKELAVSSNDLIIEAVTESKICVVLNKQNELCEKSELSLTDLNGMYFVRKKASSSIESMKQIAMATGNEGYIFPEGIDIFSFLAKNNNAFAFLPETIIKNNIYIQNGELTIRYLDNEWSEKRTFYLIYHRQYGEKMKYVLEIMRDYFK